MNENKTNSADWKVILGGIALIVVLFAGIKFIFWGLGQVIQPTKADVSQSQDISTGQSQPQQPDVPAPAYCIHCGEKLPDGFQWGQYCPFCGGKVE